MSLETSAHNDHLFRSFRQDAAIVLGESSWLTAPRTGWTEQQDAKRSKLSNSPEGRKVSSMFILGHVGGRK